MGKGNLPHSKSEWDRGFSGARFRCKKIVTKIVMRIVMRCHFDFETCPNFSLQEFFRSSFWGLFRYNFRHNSRYNSRHKNFASERAPECAERMDTLRGQTQLFSTFSHLSSRSLQVPGGEIGPLVLVPAQRNICKKFWLTIRIQTRLFSYRSHRPIPSRASPAGLLPRLRRKKTQAPRSRHPLERINLRCLDVTNFPQQ